MTNTTYRDSQEDDKKSLMHAQKRSCNGESTGFQCKHYWNMMLPVDVLNSTSLRHGEKSRLCTLITTSDGMRLQDSMPAYCNRYEPCSRPYDKNFEQYNPLSLDDIAQIDSGGSVADQAMGQPPVSVLRRLLLRILP